MSQPFVSVIACGGKSRRFGADKAAHELGGISLLDRVVAIAQGYDAPVALAGRSKGQATPADLPLLPDREPGLGPVSALLSAFAFASAQDRRFVLLLGCDQPFLPTDLPDRLLAAIGDDCGAAIPVSSGHDQNMAALWRVDEPALQDFFAGGGRSPWRYAERVGLTRVPWDETHGDLFMDIDERSDLAAAEARLAWQERG